LQLQTRIQNKPQFKSFWDVSNSLKEKALPSNPHNKFILIYEQIGILQTLGSIQNDMVFNI
jgi:hypothetical protein